MKYSLVALVAATVVVAKPQHALPPGTKIDCLKANANFCMGDKVIVRCDDTATGTQAQCDNGCVQSGREVGDARCKDETSGSGTAPGTIETSSTPPATNSPPPPPPTSTNTLIGTDTVITDPSTMLTQPIRTSLPIASGTTTEDDGCPPVSEPTGEPTGENPTGANPTGDQPPVGGGTQTDGTPTSVPTAGASTNKAMGGLALVGAVAAYFL